MNGEMPVGTANMMIEQGLTTFGSIYARQHRSLRRLLKQLWYINQHTVEDEQVQDEFGELLVTKADFTGPMTVIPVSDPNIFTDAQRMAGAQLVAGRAQVYTTAGIPLYKARQVEIYLMRNAKVPDPEQFLQDAPEPTQMTAAAENVASSMGLPIKAYPGQDHEAHMIQHGAYAQSEIFGSNPILAQKFLPPMIQHLGEHIALWYDDAMKMSMNAILREKLHDPRITLDALENVSGLEVQLDRMMAMITPHVMHQANEELQPIMEIVKKAQALLKSLAPPQPMDPSIVAKMDVDRQTEADKAKAATEKANIDHKTADSQAKNALAAKKQGDETALKQQELQSEQGISNQEMQQKTDEAERKAMLEMTSIHQQHSAAEMQHEATMHGAEVQADTAAHQAELQHQSSQDTNDVTLHTAREGNDTTLAVANINAASKVAAAKAKPKPKPAGK